MTTERKLTLLEYDDGVWKPSGEAVRCDRCKHWGAPTVWGYPHGTPNWRYGSGPCGGDLEGAKHCAQLPRMVGEFYSMHDSGGEATEMFPRPDFGCPMFEAKP